MSPGSGDTIPRVPGEGAEFGTELPVSLAEPIGETGEHSGDLFEPIFARSAFFDGKRVIAPREFEPSHEFSNGTTGDSEEISPVGSGQLAPCTRW
jgi:hypothetical protein